MASLVKIITPVIEEQQAIEELSYEVEKVLKYYEEHPQYPLDYNKIRKRIQEVKARLTKLREDLQQMTAEKTPVR
jgi:hypothetical protein